MGACACEGENLDILSSKVITARKAHKCSECGKEIRSGENYQKFVGVTSEGMFESKMCLFCYNVVKDLRSMGYCVVFDGLWNLVEQIERGDV
ncbi:hypothetical protein [Solidesulfovibrio sp. C21]|uniref:hypothetical protein n=1 Tax=Solidesulfovibrio sp. C21 TaxID=3398613 RepID=UPI0039FBA2F7